MRILLRDDNGYQGQHRDAFMAGLQVLGINDLGSDVAVSWGWRNGALYREQGWRVLVFERGYIGDRLGRYTSIGWNGLNGRATWPEYPDDGGERFRACGFELQPWRDGGDYTLLCGQVRTDAAVNGVDMQKWYERSAEEARAAYGLPVRFRPHPGEVKRGIAQPVRGCEFDTGSLSESLAGASHVITYNSNTATESLLAGCDTVAVDAGSMSYGVAGTRIGEPCKRDKREAWAHALAWKQWTLEEIASGKALEGALCQSKD